MTPARRRRSPDEAIRAGRASLNEIAATASEIARLARDVEELQRIFAVGDADRTILFSEVCDSIRRADSTVRRWWTTPMLRRKYVLDELFTKDASGRLTSTPRRLASWRRSMAARWGGR